MGVAVRGVTPAPYVKNTLHYVMFNIHSAPLKPRSGFFSVAVPVSAPAVGLAALAALSGCAADAPEPPPFAAVADDRQLMLSVLEPAAETYWDAVGVIVDEEGTHEIEPRSDEEWEAVVNAAYQLAESGNLLLMEERAQGRAHWSAMSRSMIEVGRRAIEAAEARDPEAVFDMGAELYFVCTGCHSVYATGTLRPSDLADTAAVAGVGEHP